MPCDADLALGEEDLMAQRHRQDGQRVQGGSLLLSGEASQLAHIQALLQHNVPQQVMALP